jgi:hypothetical protein
MLPAPNRAGRRSPGSFAGKAGRVTLALLFSLGVAIPGALHAIPVAAQEATLSFSTAEVTPADSVAYVVTTLDDTSTQWQLADALLDRAGVGEAIEEELTEDLQDETGEDVPLDAFLGGEVAVVVGQPALEMLAAESMGTSDLDEMLTEMGLATPEAAPAEPVAQGWAVVLDARAPDTAWTGLQESARDDGAQEIVYEGTTILFAPPDGDDGMAVARVGDLALIATTPQDLEPIIDTAGGQEAAITTVSEFTRAQEILPAESLMFGFVNTLAAQETDFGPFNPAAGHLGAEAYSAFTVAADTPGFRLESVVFPASGELLPPAPANYESDLVNSAPSDALFFSSAYDLGASGVLDAIGASLLSLTFGMGAPMATPVPDASPEEIIAQQYEDAAQFIGVNLQTGLFQLLTGEYGGWLTMDMATESVSGLFASGASDAQTVGNTLMQLSFIIQSAAGGETPLTTRDVDGGQVYVVGLGDEAGSTLEFGVVDDKFVIGTGDAVDRVASPPEDSLADNAQFQTVMATLPAEHNGLVYLDLTQAIPLAQTTAAESDDFSFGEFEDMADASENCANYASQEEAQAAYDAAESGTFDLDQDFDGEVCEDFFEMSAATPAADESDDDSDDAFANVDYSAIKAFASVSYDEDGLRRSSSMLFIAE